MQTLSARRFTVELKIKEPRWKTFLREKHYHEKLPTGDCSPEHTGLSIDCLTFKVYLENELNTRLNRLSSRING